jgi:hypothetical protein
MNKLDEIHAMMIQQLRNDLTDFKTCLNDGVVDLDSRPDWELRIQQTERLLRSIDRPHPL